jgi:hypothetical protein
VPDTFSTVFTALADRPDAAELAEAVREFLETPLLEEQVRRKLLVVNPSYLERY